MTTPEVAYALEPDLSAEEFVDVLVRSTLAERRPTIRAVNPTTWIRETDYVDQPFATSFQAFTRQRNDLLALLDPLDEADWQRAATMTGGGRPRQVTVLDHASRLARQERAHLKQLDETVRQVLAG